jgi:MFS family permease
MDSLSHVRSYEVTEAVPRSAQPNLRESKSNGTRSQLPHAQSSSTLPNDKLTSLEVLEDQSQHFNSVQNPLHWPPWRKWSLTALAIFATFTCTLNGTMITVAHQTISEIFDVDDDRFPNTYWPVASWTIGGALICLILLPLLEDLGSRKTFLYTYIVFFAFIIPQALSQNFATLIVTRLFAGGCAAVLSNTAVSVIGNIWEGERARTLPVACFVTAYLVGPSMGPVIGSAIYEVWPWRWLSYFQLILYGAMFPVYWLFFVETRHNVISERRESKSEGEECTRQKRLRNLRPTVDLLRRSIKRPLIMLFTEPIILSMTVWSSFMIGIVFLFTQSTDTVFREVYGWTAAQCGYIQAAVVIGECMGLLGSFLSAQIYFASAKKNRDNPGVPIPESRLYLSTFGSLVGVMGGMFVYAWTAYPYLPWIAPAIGLAMVGCGINIVITAIADYLVDSYTAYAASAMAGVLLVENVFAAFLPMAAQEMYKTLGVHWASTVIALVALVVSFVPLCMIIWGERIRKRSPFLREAALAVRT